MSPSVSTASESYEGEDLEAQYRQDGQDAFSHEDSPYFYCSLHDVAEPFKRGHRQCPLDYELARVEEETKGQSRSSSKTPRPHAHLTDLTRNITSEQAQAIVEALITMKPNPITCTISTEVRPKIGPPQTIVFPVDWQNDLKALCIKAFRNNSQECKIMTTGSRSEQNDSGVEQKVNGGHCRIAQMKGDGNCLFYALLHRLCDGKMPSKADAMDLRKRVAMHIREKILTQDGLWDTIMRGVVPDPEDWDDFLTRLERGGDDGGIETIVAVGQLSNRKIKVYYKNRKADVYNEKADNDQSPLQLFYSEPIPPGSSGHYDAVISFKARGGRQSSGSSPTRSLRIAAAAAAAAAAPKLSHRRCKPAAGQSCQHTVCNVCGKELASKASLKNHLRIHTGERPYECEQCLRRFKLRHHLTDHLKTHGSRESSNRVNQQRCTGKKSVKITFNN